jgi:hypothetical protein
MKIFQKKVNNKWIKYKYTKKNGLRVMNVKQRNPHIPFKGVKKK